MIQTFFELSLLVIYAATMFVGSLLLKPELEADLGNVNLFLILSIITITKTYVYWRIYGRD